mmetsp:Transcript_25457/g.79942  ORF Transcript_25457/g.79942 Transcript_25457/m.79942 type:complete len:432 (+) Transcript_25457:604-1899(+)
MAAREHLRRARGAEHDVASLGAADCGAALAEVDDLGLRRAVGGHRAPLVPREVRGTGAGPRLALRAEPLLWPEDLRGQEGPLGAVRGLAVAPWPLLPQCRGRLPRVLLGSRRRPPLRRLEVRLGGRGRGGPRAGPGRGDQGPVTQPLQEARLHHLVQLPVDVGVSAPAELLEVAERAGGPAGARSLHDLPADCLLRVPPGGDRPAPGSALRDTGRAHQADRARGDFPSLLFRLRALQGGLVLSHFLVEALLIPTLGLLPQVPPATLCLTRDVPSLHVSGHRPLDLLLLRSQELPISATHRPLQLLLSLRGSRLLALLPAPLRHATPRDKVGHRAIVLSLQLGNPLLKGRLLFFGQGLPPLAGDLGSGAHLIGAELRGDCLAVLVVPQEVGGGRSLRLGVLGILLGRLLSPGALAPLRLLRQLALRRPSGLH